MSLDRELGQSLGETRRTFKTGCHGFLYKDKDDDMVRRMSAAAIQRYNYTSTHPHIHSFTATPKLYRRAGVEVQQARYKARRAVFQGDLGRKYVAQDVGKRLQVQISMNGLSAVHVICTCNSDGISMLARSPAHRSTTHRSPTHIVVNANANTSVQRQNAWCMSREQRWCLVYISQSCRYACRPVSNVK